MDLDAIEKQLEKIPPEIKRLFFSAEAAKKIQEIGGRHGLLLDRIDALVEETGLAIIGLKPKDQFVENISKRLDIKIVEAQKISDEINREILSSIRDKLAKPEDSKEAEPASTATQNVPPAGPSPAAAPATAQDNAVSSLEQAGGFSIEKPEEEKDENIAPADVSAKDKYSILTDIENPLPAKEVKVGSGADQSFSEPLVDRMLNKPLAVPEEKNSQKMPPAAQPPKPKAPDPYHEPID